MRYKLQDLMNVLHQMGDGFWITGLNGHILDVNPAMCNLVGYTRDEMLTMSIADVEANDSRADIAQRIQKIIEKGSAQFESRFRRKDGTIINVDISINYLPDRGVFFGFHRDITTRKRAEESLRENETIFSAFLEHSPVYIFFKDKDIRSLRLSKNYEQMLGMPLAQALGKTMDELFPSDLAKSMVADDLRILNEGQRVDVVEELKGRIYETTKFPIFKDDQPFMLAGFTLDITERKRAEEELRESEERFRRLFDGAADALFVHDQQGRIFDVNQIACQSLGYTRDELMRLSVSDVEIKLQPADLAPLWEKIRAGQSETVEGIYRRRDGSTFPVEIHIALFASGDQPLFFAAARDITERKRAEEKLRRSEAKFRAVVENSNDGILFGDVSAVISYRSPSYKRINGYSDEERIGYSGFETAHPDDIPEIRQWWTQVIQSSGTPLKAEYRVRHKDGRWLWIETTAQNLIANPDV